MNYNAILFDLDGVLVDACDWHYLSLNRALKSIGINPISKQDHVAKYNGLPTAVKLDMLGLNKDECDLVWKLKQDYTLETIRKNSRHQSEKIQLLRYLKDHGIKIGCVTNSIRETTNEMLSRTGQIEYFDLILTNEDVVNNKPSPDCYNLAVNKLDINPNNCIIVEDSPKGIKAAESSVVPNRNIWIVNNSNDVNLSNFIKIVGRENNELHI